MWYEGKERGVRCLCLRDRMGCALLEFEGENGVCAACVCLLARRGVLREVVQRR